MRVRARPKSIIPRLALVLITTNATPFIAAEPMETLHFTGAPDAPASLEVLVDTYGLSRNKRHRVNQLPKLDLRVTKAGQSLIPLGRSYRVTDHPYWDWVVGPGISHAASREHRIPIALQEKGANCLHNGTLRIPMTTDAEAPVSATLEIHGETCQYFKFRLRTSYTLKATPYHSVSAIEARREFLRHRDARLRRASYTELKRKYSGVDAQAFRGGQVLDPANVSTSGLVLDGVHYSSTCPTSQSEETLCAETALPSYSLAKSLVAGMALMALEKGHPGARNARVAELVPECSDPERWDDVTLEHLLNMVTGNYTSTLYNEDERSGEMLQGFFLPAGHMEKLLFSCNQWPRKSATGTAWVYHTSDTYLLGTAMQALLRQRERPNADLFEDLILPMWSPLKLSAYSQSILRTSDTDAQPFTGYGLTFTADDLARLGLALASGQLRKFVDTAMYDEALQPTAQNPGFPVSGNMAYRHGFWSMNAAEWLGCDQYTPFVFLSGYGGINLALFPGNTIYYMVSDGGQFNLKDAARAVNKLKPLCPG